MVDCATVSLKFWKKCGTWVNEERALYLLSLVNNRLQDYCRGLEYAVSALGVINANGEEPVDEAFIRLAVARAHAGLSNRDRCSKELIKADALAAEWSDKSLTAEYQRERMKIVG